MAKCLIGPDSILFRTLLLQAAAHQMSVKIKEPLLCSPPISQMEIIPGYETTAYDAGKIIKKIDTTFVFLIFD